MTSIVGSLLIICSFLIGRESVYFEKANNDKKQNISFDFSSNTVSDNNQSVGRIYASSKGKKYYIEGICDGNISLKNKVYYKDEQAAINNSKTKAAGC